MEAWRVELRTMEIMLTEFENAAFTVFAGLLCRAILFYNLELYIPMSKVDENMKRAEKNNALRTEKSGSPTAACPTPTVPPCSTAPAARARSAWASTRFSRSWRAT